jgi:peptide/nickel transport system ATP-binding protein
MQQVRGRAAARKEDVGISLREAAASGGDLVLDVRNLSVDYASTRGAVHAVDDVSFALARGQILGLAGESGSGKSTLAHAIARLLRPPARVVQGQVLYYPRPEPATNGQEATQPPVDVLALAAGDLRAFRWRRLSFVFQSAMNALNPVMDIGAQIADVLRAHSPSLSRRDREERAAELLQLVSIAPDRLHSFPHELSGGMRQRAVIAIALALNPEAIIMDEPTTALDVVVQREILQEIIDLRNRLGFSVIFITHDLSLLLEIADRVAVMYAGRIVETATSAELLSEPRHPYTQGLLRSFPKVGATRSVLTGIQGSPPDLRALPSGCAFHPRCSFAFDACRCETPSLLASASGGGSVACHLYDESGRLRTLAPSHVAAAACDQPGGTSPTGESA